MSITNHPQDFEKTSLLSDLFATAVDAVSPNVVLAAHLPAKPDGNIVVIGAGKAAASMALALEQAWADTHGRLDGLVVTPYAHGVSTGSIEVVEAAHPVPDAKGLEVAGKILQKVSNLGPDDTVLCLISGGGSALLALPASGISLADKRDINSKLLKSGAAIDEMNTVRKHLSAIKGGRLGMAAYPARVVTLAISDVPGDDPAVIASGPTVADPTTFSDAKAVLNKYLIEIPPNISSHLEAGISGKIEETPKPGDPKMDRCEVHIIAKAAVALEAAAKAAKNEAYETQMLGDDIQGEASEIGRSHARIAINAAKSSTAKVAIISGGETTVTVRGNGRGGRNCEYLLGLVLELDGHPDISAIACDTDGIDGTQNNAGAVCGPDTLARARDMGIDGAAMLRDNDAYSFFEKLGDLVITGPTRTNVNDFRCILVR